MTSKTREKLVSSEELATMSLDSPCELVEGKIVRLSPAGRKHGRLGGRVLDLLLRHVRRKKLGVVVSSETGFLVRRDPDTVRAPDVAFVSSEADARADEEPGAYYPFAPDLAVEVLSPDDTWVEVERKAHEYLGAGGKAVWVVNPSAETVHVYDPSGVRILTKKDRLEGGEAVPGFKASLKAVFEG